MKAIEILFTNTLLGVCCSEVQRRKSKSLSLCCHVQGRCPHRHPEKHRATGVATSTRRYIQNLSRSYLRWTLKQIIATLIHTYKLNLSRNYLRLPFRRVRVCLCVVCFCRNVSAYMQTQPKQKLFDLDFKADSIALVF